VLRLKLKRLKTTLKTWETTFSAKKKSWFVFACRTYSIRAFSVLLEKHWSQNCLYTKLCRPVSVLFPFIRAKLNSNLFQHFLNKRYNFFTKLCRCMFYVYDCSLIWINPHSTFYFCSHPQYLFWVGKVK
jgi:hypothetical protein